MLRCILVVLNKQTNNKNKKQIQETNTTLKIDPRVAAEWCIRQSCQGRSDRLETNPPEIETFSLTALKRIFFSCHPDQNSDWLETNPPEIETFYFIASEKELLDNYIVNYFKRSILKYPHLPVILIVIKKGNPG